MRQYNLAFHIIVLYRKITVTQATRSNRIIEISTKISKKKCRGQIPRHFHLMVEYVFVVSV